MLYHDIHKSRANYENKLLSKGPKALYKYTKSKLTSKVSKPVVKNKDGELCANDFSTAEAFADHFESVYLNELCDNFPEILSPRVSESLDTIEFPEDIVYEELCRLDSVSSPGPDNLSPHVLRSCARTLSKPLSHIFHLSLTTSRLPPLWKKVHVIFKKGEKTEAANYRPISLTSVCVKIMERIPNCEIFAKFSTRK
ncbi:hypothetical protein Zmor_006299 [Zophobas morio]|uniref:RNA-directed DNA polymerase from mobile element jockey n=1 Tax=Zophobas morio TaxID=2755281 RepID=A0AA38MLA6_9CUCU|nr:hypothetical protein Zmor_006299 [Zophobas morio]